MSLLNEWEQNVQTKKWLMTQEEFQEQVRAMKQIVLGLTDNADIIVYVDGVFVCINPVRNLVVQIKQVGQTKFNILTDGYILCNETYDAILPLSGNVGNVSVDDIINQSMDDELRKSLIDAFVVLVYVLNIKLLTLKKPINSIHSKNSVFEQLIVELTHACIPSRSQPFTIKENTVQLQFLRNNNRLSYRLEKDCTGKICSIMACDKISYTNKTMLYLIEMATILINHVFEVYQTH